LYPIKALLERAHDMNTLAKTWDLFICHASEDKNEVVRPLVDLLIEKGFRVWYDEFSLTMGDSLRRSVDKGLSGSRYGVVILSPAFFEKEWPRKELDGLATKEIGGTKVILPVWHKVTRDEVGKYSPMLADRIAARTDSGLSFVVDEISRAIEASRGRILAGSDVTSTREDRLSASLKEEAPETLKETNAERKKVSFLGTMGSFSHEAALSKFQKHILVPKLSFNDVFDSVFGEEVDYGVLPVENSAEGIIPLTYHLLVEQGGSPKVKIVGEIYLPIHHCLATVEEVRFEDIRIVHTKPEAWEQCRVWVSRNLPANITFVPEPSTARAAEVVAQSKKKELACIASVTSVIQNRLVPLARSIQDIKSNTTRFLVLGRKSPRIQTGKKPYKATFGMVLHDRIGAIADSFSELAKGKVNVRSVKISPVRAKEALEWRDWFFVDVLTDGKNLEEALSNIQKLKLNRELILSLILLGYYPSGADGAAPQPPPPPEVERLFGLSLEDLISAGEGQFLELKSSLRWDTQGNKKDPSLEFAVVKTVAGFMNAQGGNLLIGVNDKGEVLGLDSDYKTLHKPSKDGFELHLRNTIDSFIGGDLGNLVEVRFFAREGKEICLVNVHPSSRPVWIEKSGEEEFFIRSGNRTRPLGKREITEYIKLRWR
jgi:prephenate dehydratase